MDLTAWGGSYGRGCKLVRTQVLAAMASLLPLAGLLVGCGTSPTPRESLMIAPSATANEPAPMLTPNQVAVLQHAAKSDDGKAWVLDPATWQANPVVLTPHRANGQIEHGPRRGELIEQNISKVRMLLNQAAATGPLDLVGTLTAAARVPDSPATLIVISSGLSTAGPLDLRLAGWSADPVRMAHELKAAGFLPDLHGQRVIFSGLGDVAGAQPPLPPPQRATLAGYWLAVCAASGAAECRVDDSIRPPTAPHSTAPVPVVDVPPIVHYRGPRDEVTTVVPSSWLFPLDSAALGVGADDVLKPIAVQAVAEHRTVTITGHSSPDAGTASYNRELSQARAVAVAQRLRLLAPSTQISSIIGAGTEGTTPDACRTNGRHDEPKCALLRNVVIVSIPPAAQGPKVDL